MKKVQIQKVLKVNGEWTGYRLRSWNAYSTINHNDVIKEFSSLDEITNHFQLQDVRELGTKYIYTSKGQKLGTEAYSAYLNE
jgi:hypothetical protein|tara:strand:- start:371 stop:616 length:246 start_codon:yes stop_codon:yes gene_type:complete